MNIDQAIDLRRKGEISRKEFFKAANLEWSEFDPSVPNARLAYSVSPAAIYGTCSYCKSTGEGTNCKNCGAPIQ